jgi:hypothetical protein
MSGHADEGQLQPVIPDYGGACITNVVPALLSHREIGQGWMPDNVLDAERVVLLVLDGLGALQLAERSHLAPTMSALDATRLHTVAPTTTASALTSISTGLAPGEHGIVGYKVWVGGEVINMLRWSSPQGDATQRVAPTDVQPTEPFFGLGPPTVSPREFSRTSFTEAHMRGSDYRGYGLASSIPIEIRNALADGATFVHAYYDGIDKVAHLTGLGEHYGAELAHVDRLVQGVLDVLPPGVALCVTADHGQVQVGEAIEVIDPAVMAGTAVVSGEARFVWLHASGGRANELLEAATEAHAHHAWVRSVDQIVDERWLGTMTSQARARLGDVALVARDPIAIVDPDSRGPVLQSRHGSMTEAEMYVPLLTAVR